MTIRCPLCGGEVKRKKVDYEYRRGDRYFIVRGVPALVCRDCGEALFEAEVVDELLSGDLESKGSVKGTLEEVEVTFPAR